MSWACPPYFHELWILLVLQLLLGIGEDAHPVWWITHLWIKRRINPNSFQANCLLNLSIVYLKTSNFLSLHKECCPTISKDSWTYPRLWELKLNNMTKSWPLMKYQFANIWSSWQRTCIPKPNDVQYCTFRQLHRVCKLKPGRNEDSNKSLRRWLLSSRA
jgi:hypothetical protein